LLPVQFFHHTFTSFQGRDLMQNGARDAPPPHRFSCCLRDISLGGYAPLLRMEGGTAIAEIIYGDVNPSGKLPYVVPVSEEDLPHVDWEATDQYYEYYHGYTRLEKNGVKPLVPYGFGLSYTTFEITAPEAKVEGDNLVVTANVKNTGKMDGDEVVQLYVGFENSAVDRPVKQLRGFQRISLKAGEEKKVTVSTPLEKLKWYNPVYREWQLEHVEHSVYVGSSSASEDLVKTSIVL